MAAYTAQQMLDLYTEAEVAVLAGKRVRFSDGNTEQWVESEDLEWIQKGRREWQATVDRQAARTARAPTFGGLGYSVARMDGQ